MVYKALGDIRPDPQQPGFKNILLEPHFTNGLEYFEASHEGPYGAIHSSWKRTGKIIIYTVIVPPNSPASIKLKIAKDQKLHLNGKSVSAPAGIFIKKINAGNYQFELE